MVDPIASLHADATAAHDAGLDELATRLVARAAELERAYDADHPIYCPVCGVSVETRWQHTHHRTLHRDYRIATCCNADCALFRQTFSERSIAVPDEVARFEVVSVFDTVTGAKL